MRIAKATMAFTLLGVAPIVGMAQTIAWDVIASGGEVSLASGDMQLAATVGQTGAEVLEGPEYVIWGGFWNPGIGGPVGVGWVPGAEVPTVFSLGRSHPNPSRGKTALACGLPRQCQLTVAMYDLHGKLIRVLTDGVEQAGYHTIHWDGYDASHRKAGSGVYVCRMSAVETSDMRCDLQRLVLLIR